MAAGHGPAAGCGIMSWRANSDGTYGRPCRAAPRGIWLAAVFDEQLPGGRTAGPVRAARPSVVVRQAHACIILSSCGPPGDSASHPSLSVSGRLYLLGAMELGRSLSVRDPPNQPFFWLMDWPWPAVTGGGASD